MRFWDAEGLAEDLKNDRVSEDQKARYFLATIVVYLFGLQVYVMIGWKPSLVLLGKSLIVVLVALFGLEQCYLTNKRGDNRDFIARFMCLAWPITLRVLAYSAIAAAVLEGLVDQSDDIVDLILTVIYQTWFINLMIRSIGLACGARKGRGG